MQIVKHINRDDGDGLNTIEKTVKLKEHLGNHDQSNTDDENCPYLVPIGQEKYEHIYHGMRKSKSVNRMAAL